MAEELAGIDPQKCQRQHDHDSFAKVRLAGRSEPGNRKSDEDRCGRHERAMAAGKRECGRGGAKQLH
jgi:hypothetical protein